MAWEVVDVFFFSLGLLIVAWAYGKWRYKFFESTGVKYIEPPFPFLGSMIKVVSGKTHMQDFVKGCYDRYPNEKYIGLFEVQKPLIMLRDPDLIKQIGIKDFDNFHDHRVAVSDDTDIFARTLFGLGGNKWRDMRATLSPAFSALKMKNMFVFIDECAKNLTNHCEKRIKASPEKVYEIEVKDLFSKYTNDTIATSAFGLKVDSIEDPNNEFSRIGKLSINFTDGQWWKLIALSVLPRAVTSFFKISLSRPEVQKFFGDLVQGTMKDRERTGHTRHDMIHLMMESKKGTLVHETSKDAQEIGFSTVQESEIGMKQVKKVWSDDDYNAQGFIFFIGGYDTTSALLSFFFYEIVRNPGVQKKLHEEIDRIMAVSGSSFLYNDISKFTYLDMAISETLRLWPPAAAIDRVCSKTHTLPPPSDDSDKTYTILPNELVWIPIYGIQNDPRYFENPEIFDPERFSDTSRIIPGTYLPFGIGPRNCIGSRYALMVAKTVIIRILERFEVVKTDKTEIPITLANTAFSLKAKNGTWVGLKLRK